MHGDLESISVGPQPSAVTDGTGREGRAGGGEKSRTVGENLCVWGGSRERG